MTSDSPDGSLLAAITYTAVVSGERESGSI